MNPITIAFHSSATADVEDLHRVLAEAGFTYFDIVCDSETEPARTVGGRLTAQRGPSFLLLNDGFLHGLECQEGLFDAYRELRQRENFHVVIARSLRTRPNGESELIETPLTRVSDTMRYINYWQVVYLDARREYGATATDASSRALSPIRSVSQEIGETLRLIREDAPLTIEALLAADGAALLELLGAPQPAPETRPSDRVEAGVVPGVFEHALPNGNAAGAHEPIEHHPEAPRPEEYRAGASEPEEVPLADEQPLDLHPVARPPQDDPAEDHSREEDQRTEDEDSHHLYEVQLAERDEPQDTRLQTHQLQGDPPEDQRREAAGLGVTAPAQEHSALDRFAVDPTQGNGRAGEQRQAIPAGEQSIERADNADLVVANLDAQTERYIAETHLPHGDGAAVEPEGTQAERGPSECGTRLTEDSPVEAAGDSTEEAVDLAVDSSADPGRGRRSSAFDELEEDGLEETTSRRGHEPEGFDYLHTAVAVAAASDETISTHVSLTASGSSQGARTLANEPDRGPGGPESSTHLHFVALLEAGRVHEAEALARDKLKDDPRDHRLRYYLSVALAKLSEQKRSAALIEANQQLKMLYDTPFAAAAHLLVGTIRAEARDFGSARRHYKKAYRLDKEVDPELSYRIGSLVQDAFPERRREAARFLRRATQQSEEYAADAWYRLGQIYAANTSWRKAIRAFKSARALDPAHPFAAYDLALLYLERGRVRKAARFFEHAVEANPELDSRKNRVAFAPSPAVPTVGSPATIASPASGERITTLDRLTEDEIANPRVRVLTVLITGASSGIGAATARAFAKRGHRLILTGRRIERLRALSSELSSQYRAAVRLMSFDVTDAEAAEHMLDTLPPDWNEIDLLINNAGKARGLEPIYQGRMQDWDEMIDTNVKGLLHMTRLVSPAMVERRRGHIINVCSTAGHEVYPNGAVYCATKHAVDAITKGTRLDLYKYNIRVSQVSPAAVEETEFSAVRFHGDEDKAAKVYEGFQPLRADDVAETIYFVASRPAHVDVQDTIVLATQQANSTNINRSGR